MLEVFENKPNIFKNTAMTLSFPLWYSLLIILVAGDETSRTFFIDPGTTVRNLTVAFNSCHTSPPVDGIVVAVSNNSFDFFNVTSTAWFLWGFRSTIQRNASIPETPTTVMLHWIAPNYAPIMASPTAATTTITTVRTTSATVYCYPTQIFVPQQNTSYNFPQTEKGLTSTSKEVCSQGVPMASVACLPNVTHPGHASFGAPVVINCGETLTSIASKVNVTNATTISVSVTMATLKLLTSNTSSLNETQIGIVSNVFQALSQTDPIKVAIQVSTLYDALATINQLSQSLSALPSPASPNQTINATQRHSLVKSLQVFTDRVILPPKSTEIKLISNHTKIQVTEPLVQNGKHNSALFSQQSSINGTQPQAITAKVPGTSLDHVQQSGNIKNTSSLSATPLRISFILNSNAVFFPSTETPEAILSINIRGYQSSSINIDIIISFGNVVAKQGSVPIKNDTLKDVVTRTQCSVYRSGTGQWVPTGCSLKAGSSPPKCTCYKLASFSMIVSSKILPSTLALGIVSYTGCALSILGLIVTIIVYLAIKELRVRQPTTFLLNICFNLLVVNIIFVFGVGSVSISAACYLSTILLHYFLLVTWFWMSANAYNMYKALTVMAPIGQTSTTIPSIICYLLPALIVLIDSTVAIFYEDAKHYRPDDPFFESAYRARSMCWLRYLSLDFGFLLPVGILFSFNVTCFISVMYKIVCKKTMIQSTAQRHGKRENFMFAIAVCFIMGLTWMFGFLMMIADNVTYQSIMAWLFTIFNSIQGLFLFCMNCLRHAKVRNMWWIPLVTYCRCGLSMRRRKRNSDRSRILVKNSNIVAITETHNVGS